MEIGQYFKQELEKQNVQPPADGWEKLASNPRIRRFNRWQKFKGVIIGGAAVAITATAIIVALHSRDNDGQLAQVASPHSPEATSQQMTTEQMPMESTMPAHAAPAEETPATFAGEGVEQPETAPAERETESSTDFVEERKNEQERPATALRTAPLPERTPAVTPEKVETQPVTAPNHTSTTKTEPILSQPSAPQPDENEPEEEPFFEEFPEVSNTLFVPNAFTPDGDGLNDIFLAQCSEELADFEMIISDRRGSILFRSKDIQQGWNGEHKGNILPQGTYIYVIIYRTLQGERQIKKGSINLIK